MPRLNAGTSDSPSTNARIGFMDLLDFHRADVLPRSSSVMVVMMMVLVVGVMALVRSPMLFPMLPEDLHNLLRTAR